MVGFTANAKVFVDELAKYLKLSDIFLDIATDETMAGGWKRNSYSSFNKSDGEQGYPDAEREGNKLYLSGILCGEISVLV